MTDTVHTNSHSKANGAFFSNLDGAEIRSVQQRLLGSLLRQPEFVSTVSTTGIMQDDFPEEWRHAFIVATKEPGRAQQIVADPHGDPIIRQLYTQVVLLGHGQARQMAEQIVTSVRRRDAVQNQRDERINEYSTDTDNVTETVEEFEHQQDDPGPNTQKVVDGLEHRDDQQKSNGEDRKEQKRSGFWIVRAAESRRSESTPFGRTAREESGRRAANTL